MRFALAPAAFTLAVLAAPFARAETNDEPEVKDPWTTAPAPTAPTTPAAPPAAPAPKGGTTVVAPPGGGVTVVAPTAGGGTVTAHGCAVVQVEGSPAVVQGVGGSVTDTACAPYQPADAPAPKIIYVHDRPRFAPDGGRSTLLALGAVAQGLGSLVLGAWYAQSMQDEHYECMNEKGRVYSGGSYAYQDYASVKKACGSAGAWGSLAIYTANMAFAPTAASFQVGATKRAWIFAGAITASIAAGKLVDMNDEKDGWRGVGLGGAILGFVVPATLGIVALATTPHREDLQETKPDASLTNFGIAPVGDRQHGVTGASLALGGKF